MNLYPFQKTGSAWLSQHPKTALLADEMGLGKTVQTIDAFAKDEKVKTVLVVCPASLKYNWQREVIRWSGISERDIFIVNGSKVQIPKRKMIIINYDVLHRPNIFRQLRRAVFDLGIFDEAHYMKSRISKRTHAVLLKNGVASRCRTKWFLTGTPVLNRPVELYPLLKAACPEVIKPYDNFERFAKRWCGAYWDGYQLCAQGASNINDLNERLINSGFMLRRLKAQVLKELPERQFQIIPVCLRNGKLPAKWMNWSIKDAKRSKPDHVGIYDLAELRHELADKKFADSAEYITDLLLSKEKLVIFGYHKSLLNRLKLYFSKEEPAFITGDTPPTERQEEIDRFQEDPKCRLFIGQFQAAGVGVTLTAADTAVFVEISWVPGEIMQAADRLHRIGQKSNVLIQFVVIKDSLEEFMMRRVIEKKLTVERIIEQRNQTKEKPK